MIEISADEYDQRQAEFRTEARRLFPTPEAAHEYASANGMSYDDAGRLITSGCEGCGEYHAKRIQAAAFVILQSL